jgi:predicted unusual protein kinase regulating ubiquinone biosynthesis (AarF/ABC1/UbiB family)
VERLRAALGAFPRLGAPRVYEELSTSRLLVLEEIQGVAVREIPEGPARGESARQLLECYYRQILVEGFFHADPHPGNMLWWNERIYFLDFGMVGELSPEMRGQLLLLLLAFWQEDVPFMTEVVLIMAGPEGEEADAAGLEADLTHLLHRYRHASLGEISLGPLLQEVAHTSTQHGVRLPASLVLTGKALAQMQLAATELDPELDPFSVVGRFLMKNLVSRAQAGADPKRIFYDVQKLKVRGERLVESFERISGARPGQRLQVDVRGIRPLERTVTVAARRLALAITAGSALVATGTTAAAQQVDRWVPSTLGALGAALTLLLLLDLFRGRKG